MTATIVSTSQIAVLVVGIGKLFTVTYPQLGFDAVEVVVAVGSDAVVSVCGGDPVIYAVVSVAAVAEDCMLFEQSAGFIIGIVGEVEGSIENRCSFTIIVVGITSDPTDGIDDGFLTV